MNDNSVQMKTGDNTCNFNSVVKLNITNFSNSAINDHKLSNNPNQLFWRKRITWKETMIFILSTINHHAEIAPQF